MDDDTRAGVLPDAQSSGFLRRLGQSWRDAVRDATLIVLSILIAFALQAWWDNQQNRVEEARLLGQLQAEFYAAQGEWDRALAIHLARRDAGRSLLSLFGKPQAGVSTDSIYRLWQLTLRRTTFDPPQGALVSIVSAGKLSLIRDDTLRNHLARWSGVLANIAKTEENLRIINRDIVLPWLNEQTPFPPADSITSAFPVAVEPLLQSYVFENLIRMLVSQTEIILREHRDVAAQMDSISGHLSHVFPTRR